MWMTSDLWRHKSNLSTNHMHRYIFFFCFMCSSSDPMGDFWLIFFMCRGDIRVFQMQFLLLKNFPKVWRFFENSNVFYLKGSRFGKFLNFKIPRQQFSLLCFSMFVVQVKCLYLVYRLLYGVLPETTFFAKNGRTWPRFDLYNFWFWVTSGKFFFSEDA